MTRLMATWARFLDELRQPSPADESPYLWLLVALGHIALGAAAAAGLAAVQVPAPAIPAAVALAYWYIKERADLRRGGLRLDSLVDAAFVGLGAAQGLIPGHALVAPLLAFVAMMLRGVPPIRDPP